MGLTNCEIIFDNPYSTYHAGQTLNGRVEFTFNSPKTVKGININISGKASVSWSESESKTDSETGRSETDSTTYSAEEEYFKIQYYLLGGGSSSNVELPAGKHSYPFTCALPPSLPSSFEGEYGFIRYIVLVTLERPWKFDQVVKSAFTVVSYTDLNSNPRLQEPVKITTEKHFCCCCCKSGPLLLTVSMPMTGYVPGQKIPIVVDIDNASNVTVSNVRLLLSKVTTFYANPNRISKRSENIISEFALGAPISGGETKNFNRDIEVPALPPSNLTNCGIIDLDYVVKVFCKASGLHMGLEAQTPITIGTIPLASMQSTIIAPQNTNNLPMGIIGWNAPGGDSTVPEKYAALPPPSYAECQFGTKSIKDKTDNEHTFYGCGNRNFAPRYPVYSFGPTAPPSQY